MNHMVNRFKAIREKLVPLWLAHHEAVSRQPRRYPVPADPSSFMCRHTSIFIQRLLAAQGEIWSVVGGDIVDCSGKLHPHFWVENELIRIDLTASQFGYPDEVLLTQLDDARYKMTDRLTQKNWTTGLNFTVSKWLAAWHANVN